MSIIRKLAKLILTLLTLPLLVVVWIEFQNGEVAHDITLVSVI